MSFVPLSGIRSKTAVVNNCCFAEFRYSIRTVNIEILHKLRLLPTIFARNPLRRCGIFVVFASDLSEKTYLCLFGKERTINKPRKFDVAIFFEFKAKNVGVALATARLFNFGNGVKGTH